MPHWPTLHTGPQILLLAAGVRHPRGWRDGKDGSLSSGEMAAWCPSPWREPSPIGGEPWQVVANSDGRSDTGTCRRPTDVDTRKLWSVQKKKKKKKKKNRP
eukprot:NODE_6217_length_521_cov_230.809013.p4 GENE.NODE_6217_length_521_cov_230.809013~~NODE_6217_length_521_cov_230.809013.p4  ORF type:complete len:101 (+),score=30.76 NODE_6217_length_521_cov_230.809013:151-453(+)